MRDRCIADELIRQLPRDNLLSLVSHCAEGLRYVASPIFLSDPNLPAKIAVFAMRTEFVGTDIRSEIREYEQVVTVMATPVPPNMRVQIWCRVDWFATEWGRRFEPAFTPCEVAADIMRYLLRMVEGIDRAEAWQPRRVTETREFAPLLQPITLDWRISELVRWVEDYRSDTNSDIGLFHSQAKGSIDIYASPFTLVGMYCENPVNGAIEVIPYVLEGATPKAIAELQKWRDALEAAVSERQRSAAATGDVAGIQVDPTALGIRAKQLKVRASRLQRWDKIQTEYYPRGLTQREIADKEDVSEETIKADFKDMREHKLLPPVGKATP